MQETVDSLKAPLRSVTAAGTTLVIAVLLAHAWVSLASGADVNHVSGVWLALARDVREGLFYRDLIGPTGYGGTRYFPLFFLLIAAFMGVGLDPLVAGYAASSTGLCVFVTGGYALLTRLGVGRDLAAPITALATLAPYFTQQSVFAIRAEPLAAGLALWGLAAVAVMVRQPAAGTWRTAATAAALFTLAAAAKPTSAHAAAAAVVVLAGCRRWLDASRLAVLAAAGFLVVVFGIDLITEGRFLQSIRTGALGGETPRALLSAAVPWRTATLIATSRLLTVVLLLAAVALVASPAEWRRLPAWLLVSAAAATALALGTPGTIITNQVVELYAAAVLFLGWSLHQHPRAARAGSAVLSLLLVWTAGQNATRIVALRAEEVMVRLPAERAAAVTAVAECGGAVLAESPLGPVLAQQPVILLDPFAFRVAAADHPAIADDLIARIARQQFACVVLEHDPEEPRGAGWYRHVHFGWPVLAAILQHYEYRGSAGGQRFYTPRGVRS